MLAEIKARAISIAAREVIERFVPPVQLKPKEDASLETARVLDLEQGDFKGSADRHYSVLMVSQDPEERAQALIGLSQELINLGSFKQAKHWLLSHDIREFGLSHRRSLFFRARIYEKLGWIADYEMDFSEEEKLMDAAGDILLQSKPEEEWEDEEKEVFSTTRHFLGRAKYSLAALGIDRVKNVDSAIDHFQRAMDFDEKLTGSHVDGKLGFGCSWIARCYMLVGDFTQADECISRAEHFFQSQVRRTPERTDFMAHFYTIRGERYLRGYNPIYAQFDFVQALDIRRKQGNHYPKGLADAYLGLAIAFRQKGELIKAVTTFREAVRAHPYSVFRTVLGG